MTHPAKLAVAAALALALGACTTLSDKDRALLDAASQNAAEAKQQAAAAAATAQQALDAAKAAEASAAQAATAAQEAEDKADRIFQRGLRKS